MTDREIKELGRKIAQREAYLELWEHKIARVREDKLDILREMKAQLAAAKSEG